MTVSGTTRFYALLADPVHHVRTPTLLNDYFAERGIDASVVPIHVTREDLATVVSGLRRWRNLAGIGVTVPHKEAMTALVDELSPMATLCGATNVVRRESSGRLVGGQFDGSGFVRSLREVGHKVDGARVLLAGAGGTGHALAFALAAEGASMIVIHNRTTARAQELADAVAAAYPACRTSADLQSEAATFDLVVNATTLGMQHEEVLPVPVNLLVPGAVVADVVMTLEPTPLLRAAAKRGSVTHVGERMLEAQFAETVEFLGLGAST